MSLRRCLIAVGQLTSTADVASNFAAVATLIREASSRGARMLFLPEATHSLGAAPGAPSAAERLDGPSMKKYASMAKDNNIWLSVGFPEKDEVIDAEADRESAASVDSVPRPAGASHAPPKRRGYNSHIIISDCGHIVGSYRKVHLFDLDLPSAGVRLRESDSTAPGSELVIVEGTPVGRLGLSVCYDIRFPALYQTLAAAGADVLAVPSAFTVPTGSAHWELLLRARAVETQCYVVAAAQVGRHNESRVSYGHAMIVDPWGTVIAQCSDAHSPCLAMAEIDLDWQADLRARMPLAAHKRPDVYASVPRVIRSSPTHSDSTVAAGAAAGAAAAAAAGAAADAAAGAAVGAAADVRVLAADDGTLSGTGLERCSSTAGSATGTTSIASP